MSKGIDEETFADWRKAELKHGRVAQAAVLGLLIQDVYRFPGYISPIDDLTFSEIPNGIAAFGAVPFFGWVQLIAFVGFLDSAVFKTEKDFTYTAGVPENSLSGPGLIDLKNKELQNGRIAMIAISEILTHNIAVPSESLFTLHHF